MVILNISYKWNHTLCDLLCLASFTQHNDFKVPPHGSMYQYLISFYYQIIFHCMDRPYFVYPFISRWTFTLFSTLAIINNFAMNINVQIFVGTSVYTSPGYIPRSGTVGSYGHFMYNPLRTCHTFSKRLHQFTFSPTM